jgi:hypothetical protein
MIPGPRGEIRVRIYRPDLGSGHPVITYFHGSAFVICSVNTHDTLCRHLCLRSNAVVVSVDYGLGPENKFPAGPDDSLAATRWVAGNAASFGGDPARLAVAGDCVALRNDSPRGDYVPRPDSRPVTRFERRGQRLGHGVWDLAFRRT